MPGDVSVKINERHVIKVHRVARGKEIWQFPCIFRYILNRQRTNPILLRAGSANSDKGLSGGSVRPQPKMAGMRRADEQTSASEPHSDIQGEGGFGRHQGRKDAFGVGSGV